MTYGDGLTGRYSVYANTDDKGNGNIIYLYTNNENGIQENTDLKLDLKYYSNGWKTGIFNVVQYNRDGGNVSFPFAGSDEYTEYDDPDEKTLINNNASLRITSNMKDLDNNNPIDTRKKYFIYSKQKNNRNFQYHFWKYWKPNISSRTFAATGDLYSDYKNDNTSTSQQDHRIVQFSFKKRDLPDLSTQQ